MSNINKQALRSTSERDWFEDWFKREFHPDKTGPYIKDQLFFAVRAARAPLLDELEAAENRIAELEAREVVVNLPAYVDGRTLGYGEVNHMIDLCADAIEKAGHAAGIITKVGE